MTTAQTSPTANRGQVWRAWRQSRGSYRAAPEVSPVAPVDRGGCRRGSGRHRGDGCSLRGLVNVDALDPLDERVAV